MRIPVRVIMLLTACVLLGQHRRAPAGWWTRASVDTTAFYVVKTDLPRKEAQAYGRHLDLMYREYKRRLSSFRPRTPEKLKVFIFSSQADYARTLKERFNVDSSGTSGLFFVNAYGSGLAFWTETRPAHQIRGLIQHEAFHQFAYSRFEADLPVWVNEGLAEFFGSSVVVGDTLKGGQATPHTIERVRRAIDSESHVPFREMLTMSHEAWNERVSTGRAAGLYDQAWSMIHFLAYGDRNRYREPFEEYLRRVNQRTPAQAAFNDVFGSEVDPFEEEWKAYVLDTLQPSPLLTVLERLEFLAEGARELAGRERGEDEMVPDSIEALRDALRDIGFEQHITAHGRMKVMSARDDAMFEVPGERKPVDETTTRRRRKDDTPRFVVKSSRRARDPLPPQIRTENFSLGDLVVRWSRDRKTRELRYEIVGD